MTRPRDLSDLERRVRAFRDERDWARFHTPKDLAISVALEAAELLEHFQWKDDATVAAHLSDDDARRALSHEMADVLLLLLGLADATGVDLHAAAVEKLAINATKYPVERSHGSAAKYDRLPPAADDRNHPCA
jgi:NTP pyrophosphatase (non-canonical NTP hydrolase)